MSGHHTKSLSQGIACAVALLVGLRSGEAAPAQGARTATGPLVKARAAVVMDAATGALIYAKDPDRRLPPASTTKVMTAVLAVESGRLDDSVVVSSRATRVQPSKLYLRAGERARLRDLTYALLLKSANDASVVVAEALGGSVAGFTGQMNRRAAELGARNTNFVNPNGLPAHGHYSSARDLALIFRHALSLSQFRDAAATRALRLNAWRGHSRRRSLYVQNNNRLLSSYQVPVIGKTGYTRAAKRCFVGAAKSENGQEIIVALLGSTDLWGDARRLLDFGLAHSASTLKAEKADTLRSPEPPVRGAGVFVLGRRGVPTAAPPPDLDGAETYSVLLVPAHNSRPAAERLRHYVDRRGHYAVVEAVGPPRERVYRVRILGLPDLDAALETGAELRAEHLQPTIIPPG